MIKSYRDVQGLGAGVTVESPGNTISVETPTVKSAKRITSESFQKKSSGLNKKVQKFIQAKSVSKSITKPEKISININEIVSQPTYTKDKNRFFNGTFEAEKRQLFFD